jgi:Ca-activated chloride channel family protein
MKEQEKIEVSAIVFDKTGSMSGTDLAPTRLEAAKEAAIAFIRRKRILDGRDRTTVIAFNESALVCSAFGRHPHEAHGDVRALTADGGTNITAGLQAALEAVTAEAKRLPSPTLRCVLLTDGEHNSGPSPMETGVVDAMKRAGVIVDCVAIGGAGDALLKEIAKRTGGQFVRCVDFASLLRHYEDLATKRAQSAAGRTR